MERNNEEEKNSLIGQCPHCGSENVYAITRVTGYFSKTSMWNKGKIAELKDRERGANKMYFSENN